MNKLAKYCVISCEITLITKIGRELAFTIENCSETRFCEMLKIAFVHEFSVNVNSNAAFQWKLGYLSGWLGYSWICIELTC